MATFHCDWDDESVYKYTDPHEINQHKIQYVNNSFRITEKKSMCSCTDYRHFNCTIDGQAYQLNLISNITDSIEFPVIIKITEGPNTAYKSYNMINYFKTIALKLLQCTV